ncbi:asparagine synthetase B family protein [Shewanella halotolerans]|uniref:asparagine synthetase B family protein n=1 Tax=Shewanella halotolerans TaxID=2864204 RepID=UPI001C657432|nr:asparagine synthetase B [Shewanella halotolerans]QYJ88697.1 asparagine synthetase B [Shewanella halotolerans]
MCGLVATYNLDKTVFDKSFERIKFRGKDAHSELAITSKLRFGHARLAINGLGLQGKQPMRSYCKRYVIVFNGEIYNFRSLSKRYLGTDYQSDTRVFVEFVSKFGISKSLEYFDGPYAFVLYDNLESKLFFARDVFGEKPLYYLLGENSLHISSSFLSFDDSKPFSSEVDFLNTGRLSQSKNTVGGLSSVKPGKLYSYSGNQITISDFSSTLVRPLERNFLFSTIFEEQVRRISEADVPCGLLLSGGVDSTSVAVALKNCEVDISTFTLAFDDPRIDESHKAIRVANALGFKSNIVNFDDSRVEEYFVEYISQMDQPIGDQAGLPFYILAKEAAKSVKVVLTGDGGDEKFAGYEMYSLYNRLNFLPGSKFLYSILGRLGITDVNSVCKLLLSVAGDELFRYKVFTSNPYAYQRVNYLYSDSLFPNLQFSNEEEYFSKAQCFDFDFNLPEGLLVKTDRLTMVNSIEARTPFLSRRYSSEMCDSEKRNLYGKQLIRKYIASYFSGSDSFNTPKQGFISPVYCWLNGGLRNRLFELLASDGDTQRSEHYKKLFFSLKPDSFKACQALWFYIVLQSWLQINKRCL